MDKSMNLPNVTFLGIDTIQAVADRIVKDGIPVPTITEEDLKELGITIKVQSPDGEKSNKI